MNRNLVLAFCLRAINGLNLGLYILIYIKVIGALSELHWQNAFPDIHLNSSLYGAAYLFLIFSAEIMLQIKSGVLADTKGHRFALGISFIVRSMYFLLFAKMVTLTQPVGNGALADGIFFVCWIGSAILFAVAYTTLEGNYEVWLRSLVSDGTGKRIYAFSSATQYGFTMLGGLISLYYFGAAQSASNILASKTLTLPFVIAAVSCLIAFAVTILIDGEKKPATTQPHVSEQVAASILYPKIPNLKNIFWLGSSVYAMLQLLSIVVPLSVLSQQNTLGDRTKILVLGTFGPAFCGALWAAIASKEKRSSSSPSEIKDDLRRLRATVLWFAASVTALSAVHILLGRSATMMMIAMALARFLHGRIDPQISAMATLAISRYGPEASRISSTLMANGMRYKNWAGAIVCTLIGVCSIAVPDQVTIPALFFPGSLALAIVCVLVTSPSTSK